MSVECRDPWHISEDRPECSCIEDAAWEAYRERVRIHLCLPCQAGDHSACDTGMGCDCSHATEPALEPMETPC